MFCETDFSLLGRLPVLLERYSGLSMVLRLVFQSWQSQHRVPLCSTSTAHLCLLFRDIRAWCYGLPKPYRCIHSWLLTGHILPKYLQIQKKGLALDTGSLAKWLAQALSLSIFFACAKMLKVMLESINKLYVGENSWCCTQVNTQGCLW